ncbi:MAG: dihydropteroate synthase [Rikenellaceae bacterium]
MLNLNQHHIMTILNVTPDSFFEGSRCDEEGAIRSRIERAIAEGATIIDIGGYSSRPGADDVSIELEWQRVDLGFGTLRKVSSEVVVSVDTFRAEIVRRCAEKYGYFVVNDIMAGEGDPQMFDTVAKYRLPYIAMHMRGTPQQMQSMTEYRDVAREVTEYLQERIKLMRQAGIEEIVIDPGFGFAKSLKQNYELMASLPMLCELGYPVLVGISRKSMIYRALNTTPTEALTGTIALNWEALRQGATILRVHDTREAVETLQLYRIYEKSIKQ